MGSTAPVVALVDDDESMREALPDLLAAMGYAANVFASAREFLESDVVELATCLIADVATPGMTGPELYRDLRARGNRIPVIFITAHQDAAGRERMMAEGAVEYLFKPFSDTALQAALHAALGSKEWMAR